MARYKVAAIAGALVIAGAIAAVAQPWQGRQRLGGDFGFGDMMDGMGHGPGRRGMGLMGGRMGPGMGLKALDANSDGAVTQEEFLAPHEKRFGEIDANKDGNVDAAELAALMRPMAEFRMKRFMRALDENKDGKITKEEFQRRARQAFSMRDMNDDGRIDADDLPPGMKERVQAWREKRKADGAAKEGADKEGEGRKGGRGPRAEGPFTLDRMLGRVNERFASYDRNSDGVIDAKDLEAIANERIEWRVKMIMRRLDANRDGRISKDEFLARAKARFVELDMNDDGRLTEEDLPPMMRGRGILKGSR